MNNLSSAKDRPGSWFNLILESRRMYTHNKLQRLDGLQSFSLKRMLKWLYLDARFIFQQCKEILHELEIYGPSIKNQYQIPIIKQFLQQLYLVFFLRVSLKHYRGYLLFKRDRWATVRQFTYENYPVQMKLVNYSYPQEQSLFDNKLNFFRYCNDHDISTPPVLGAFKDGRVIFPSNGLFELPAEDLFVKELCGRRGQGITKYAYNNGSYISNERGKMQSGEVMQLIQAQSQNNKGMIIQRPLKNHQKWRKFTSGALSTCRVLTARSVEPEEISIVAATLRMPVGCTETDNTSTGGIACAVNIETGILGKGIRKTPYDEQYEFDRHPNTNQLVFGTTIPHWNELLDFTVKAHRAFNTAFVGWDIALTTNEFILVEGNIGWSVRIVESPQGRALSQTQFPMLYQAWMKKHFA